MNYKQANITFWFKELEYNPICKVNVLESELSNYFHNPFLINEQEPFINIGMSRIIATNENNYLFNMSLVNANLNINLININDKDEIILKINELTQTLYDILKEIYNLEFIYCSVKIEFSEYIEDKDLIKKDYLINNDIDYEDFQIKTSISKDNKYYINNIIAIMKEIKVDINLPKGIKLNDADMLARSMLVSIDSSKKGLDVLNKTIEINNRLSFNNDEDYLVTKDELRYLLFEFKTLLDNE